MVFQSSSQNFGGRGSEAASASDADTGADASAGVRMEGRERTFLSSGWACGILASVLGDLLGLGREVRDERSNEWRGDREDWSCSGDADAVAFLLELYFAEGSSYRSRCSDHVTNMRGTIIRVVFIVRERLAMLGWCYSDMKSLQPPGRIIACHHEVLLRLH